MLSQQFLAVGPYREGLDLFAEGASFELGALQPAVAVKVVVPHGGVQSTSFGASSNAAPLQDVLAVLGVADARLLEATVDAVATGDAKRALQALEECAVQGRDAGSFASDLEVRARELLVVQVLGELPDELSLTPEADAALRAQAARSPLPRIHRRLAERS